MNWNALETMDQLAAIDAESVNQPVLIFKHSTRCNISATALARMERAWGSNSPIKPYYLDLIAFRAISNEIAQRYKVEHQSPQALLIKNGECVYTESHMGINADDLLTAI